MREEKKDRQAETSASLSSPGFVEERASTLLEPCLPPSVCNVEVGMVVVAH